jgi:DNA-binding YbaB/EbfC family protein
MRGDINKLMKQAQKMQQEMVRVQEELKTMKVQAQAGGGVVEAEVTGDKQLVALRIAPEAVDPDDVEMLQDLVIAAVNEALRKADEMASEAMSKVAGPMGAKFPGF